MKESLAVEIPVKFYINDLVNYTEVEKDKFAVQVQEYMNPQFLGHVLYHFSVQITNILIGYMGFPFDDIQYIELACSIDPANLLEENSNPEIGHTATPIKFTLKYNPPVNGRHFSKDFANEVELIHVLHQFKDHYNQIRKGRENSSENNDLIF